MEIDIHDRAPEHKAGIAGADAQALHDEFMRMFETFKAENEQRLAEVARQGSADPLRDEKMACIEQRLDDLTVRNASMARTCPYPSQRS